MELKRISNKQMDEILINLEDDWNVPEGIFYARDLDKWVLFSNNSSNVDYEEFKTREEMIEYLKIIK